MVLHLPLALESALQASSNCDHGSIIEGLTTARPHSVLSHTKSTIWSDSNGMRSCWVLFNSEGLHELMKVFRRWQMTSGIYPRHGVLAKALSQTCAEGQCRRANLQLWIGGALWGPWLAEHLSQTHRFGGDDRNIPKWPNAFGIVWPIMLISSSWACDAASCYQAAGT